MTVSNIISATQTTIQNFFVALVWTLIVPFWKTDTNVWKRCILKSYFVIYFWNSELFASEFQQFNIKVFLLIYIRTISYPSSQFPHIVCLFSEQFLMVTLPRSAHFRQSFWAYICQNKLNCYKHADHTCMYMTWNIHVIYRGK